MPLDSPLNSRQFDVLTWIRDGCPEGRWNNFTYKTVAVALQSRRLVTVSKRGGCWTATMLPAGLHYLAAGDYPQAHWQSRPGRISAGIEPGAIAASKGPEPSSLPPVRWPTPRRSPSAHPPDGLTPTRKLLKDIIDGGGILERNSEDDKTNYRSLVSIINRRKMLPDAGKRGKAMAAAGRSRVGGLRSSFA